MLATMTRWVYSGRQQVYQLVLHKIGSPIVRLLANLGASPNQITALGLLLSAASGYWASQGEFFIAGILLVIASLLDAIDGMLARSTGSASKAGALFDSVADRLSEASVLLGIFLYYAWGSSNWLLLTLVYLVLANSFLVSYIRARSESLGVPATVGVMGRPERMIVLTIGFFVGWIPLAMGIIVSLSLVTWLYRLVHSWRALKES